MTTQDIVDAPAAVTRGRLLINIAEGIETEDMPSPIAITFYEKGSPDWGLGDTIALTFADSRDLHIWIAHLGWTARLGSVPSTDGRKLIHSAIGNFHGWHVSASATDPAPSTEEPDRTLTAVEDHAARSACIRCQERPSASLTGLCEPCTVSGGRASGSGWDDVHEHGFTFREGLGHLADDPFCDGCCELATAKWKSSWQRPTTDAETVTADVDAKTAEAGAE